ncbi:MAG: hypothetical protein CL920_28205 [Deltaproteobacteria bacterium]|nr:hypothetical protein [Deltaproteobacteria bacterium]MBU52597.1 hypothetical protein [Deltaproteobacteria bacterium]|tara:strand:- start:240 stop:1040 length:801 start_codon:yes stop_codon:yes gene_type:complete
MKKILCTILLGLWTLFACQGPPEPREEINELRVLAIRAEPPTAKPGDKVKLDVLTTSPDQQTVTYQWFLCTSPEQASTGCHEDSAATKLGTTKDTTLDIPQNALDNLDEVETLRGRYLIVTLVAKGTEKEVIATKRIVVSTNQQNNNPTITGLTLTPEGETTPLTEPYKGKLETSYTLLPKVTADSQESYTRVTAQNEKKQDKEVLFYSWYTSKGSYSKGYLSQSPDPQNTYISPKEAPGKPVTIFLLVRDGRGGVDWLTKEITIE